MAKPKTVTTELSQCTRALVHAELAIASSKSRDKEGAARRAFFTLADGELNNT